MAKYFCMDDDDKFFVPLDGASVGKSKRSAEGEDASLSIYAASGARFDVHDKNELLIDKLFEAIVNFIRSDEGGLLQYSSLNKTIKSCKDGESLANYLYKVWSDKTKSFSRIGVRI